MAKPVDALYEQLKVMRWYELATEEGIQPRSTPHASYEMHAKAAEVVVDHRTANTNNKRDVSAPAYLAALLIKEAESLNQSETFFVTADMGRIVDVAARTLPFEVLRQTDLPCPSGFVYFDEVLSNVDPSLLGQARRWFWPIRAIRWGPTRLQDQTRPGIEVAIYADGPNDHLISADREGSQWPASRHRLWLEDYDGWAFDLDWFHAEPDNPSDRYPEPDVAQRGGVVGAVVWQRKVLLSFFRLCFQKIAVIHRETSRQGTRQALRGGLRAPDPGTIQIVKLRREARPPGPASSSPIEWSHQWIVKGFWRNQWYPSLGRHQSIYIHDFIKGPTDKPLVIKDRIYSLER